MHTALASSVWHVISERALELDEWTAEVRANIIDQWEITDPEGLELTLHVRPNVQIQDKPPWNGRMFDAEDLAFNLNRIAGNTAEEEGIPITSFQRRSTLAGMDHAEAIDDLTVKVVMAKPASAFFQGLTEIRNQLMPRGVVEVGFDDPTKLAGFGAFQMEEFEPGVRELYKKHPNYYREGEPYFDQVEALVLPDRASTVAAFISGEVSYFSSPLPHEKTAMLGAVPDASFYEYTGTNWYHIRPNTQFGSFGDFRVRKAMQLAPDFDEIATGYWGEGWTSTAVVHPDYPEGWSEAEVRKLPGYNPDTKEADRNEAAKLLDAAGHKDGDGIEFQITHQVTSSSYSENALRYQDQMTKLFPKMKIDLKAPPDAATFAKLQAERDFDAVSYTITTLPDVVLELHSQFHTDGSRNYGSFSDPKADDLIDRALVELDMDARAELMEQFQTAFMNEWQPLVELHIGPERYLLQPGIGGFDTTAGPWGFTGYRLYNKASRWYEVS